MLSYKTLRLEAQQSLQEERLHSIPKLLALHIISVMDIHRIHTNNIAIMLIIQIKYFIEFFF